jgi:hypothetical protein
VRKYYLELLPLHDCRTLVSEQDYILDAIIADELYDVGWNQYEVSRYINNQYEDIYLENDC